MTIYFRRIRFHGENMVSRDSCFALLVMTMLAGCGVSPVTGGTAGTLKVGDEIFSDVQVTVQRVEGSSFKPEGFGVTDIKGEFKLMTTGARGPLWLGPGEYRFTLDTAGAPIHFPPEYMKPETTPLKVSRSGSNDPLVLEVPASVPVK